MLRAAFLCFGRGGKSVKSRCKPFPLFSFLPAPENGLLADIPYVRSGRNRGGKCRKMRPEAHGYAVLAPERACFRLVQCLHGPPAMLVGSVHNACAARGQCLCRSPAWLFASESSVFFASERRALFLFRLSIFRYPSVHEPYAENRLRVFGQAVCRPEITYSRRVGDAKCQKDKERVKTKVSEALLLLEGGVPEGGGGR